MIDSHVIAAMDACDQQRLKSIRSKRRMERAAPTMVSALILLGEMAKAGSRESEIINEALLAAGVVL